MINNVVLVGRLTKDPELRYSSSNIPMVYFTIAVNRTFADQSGKDKLILSAALLLENKQKIWLVF